MKQSNQASKYQFTYKVLHGNYKSSRMDEIHMTSEWFDIAKNQLRSTEVYLIRDYFVEGGG